MFESGNRGVTSRGIKVYSAGDFSGMRRAGELAARTLDMIGDHVRPGVTTGHLDSLCHKFIVDAGAVPSPLNYRGFPKSTCISLNHVVCHGIPGDRALRDGDILNIDVTCRLDGWHGDTSRMFVVGPVRRKHMRLIEVTHEALMLGIERVRPGGSLNDMASAIQRCVERNRMSVVRDFCGHGIGLSFHEPPNIHHHKCPDMEIEIVPGMFFTIEPMVNLGRPGTKVLADDWTAVTCDREWSAQFEHTVGVTETGCEIFTLSPEDRFFPKM